MAIGKERDQRHTYKEVRVALEQLQADKKTPGSLKLPINHMLFLLLPLCLVLAKN